MSPRSVTAQIERAGRRREGWTSTIASVAAWVYAARRGLTVDWDADAGEAWIRLIGADGTVAYIGADLPLLLTSDAAEAWPYPIVVIEVSDLRETLLGCNPEVLEAVFGNVRDRAGFDPEAFTAEALWYSTV